jgi:hypothetical protein
LGNIYPNKPFFLDKRELFSNVAKGILGYKSACFIKGLMGYLRKGSIRLGRHSMRGDAF